MEEEKNIHSQQQEQGTQSQLRKIKASVLDLKKLIQEVTEIPVERQKLVYKGQYMLDNDAIDKHIKENDQTIHLMVNNQQQQQQNIAQAPTQSQGQSHPSNGSNSQNRIHGQNQSQSQRQHNLNRAPDNIHANIMTTQTINLPLGQDPAVLQNMIRQVLLGNTQNLSSTVMQQEQSQPTASTASQQQQNQNPIVNNLQSSANQQRQQLPVVSQQRLQQQVAAQHNQDAQEPQQLHLLHQSFPHKYQFAKAELNLIKQDLNKLYGCPNLATPFHELPRLPVEHNNRQLLGEVLSEFSFQFSRAAPILSSIGESMQLESLLNRQESRKQVELASHDLANVLVGLKNCGSPFLSYMRDLGPMNCIEQQHSHESSQQIQQSNQQQSNESQDQYDIVHNINVITTMVDDGSGHQEGGITPAQVDEITRNIMQQISQSTQNQAQSQRQQTQLTQQHAQPQAQSNNNNSVRASSGGQTTNQPQMTITSAQQQPQLAQVQVQQQQQQNPMQMTLSELIKQNYQNITDEEKMFLDIFGVIKMQDLMVGAMTQNPEFLNQYHAQIKQSLKNILDSYYHGDLQKLIKDSSKELKNMLVPTKEVQNIFYEEFDFQQIAQEITEAYMKQIVELTLQDFINQNQRPQNQQYGFALIQIIKKYVGELSYELCEGMQDPEHGLDLMLEAAIQESMTKFNSDVQVQSQQISMAQSQMVATMIKGKVQSCYADYKKWMAEQQKKQEEEEQAKQQNKNTNEPKELEAQLITRIQKQFETDGQEQEHAGQQQILSHPYLSGNMSLE